MADSSDVDAAIVARLAADAALTALMPHGVYFDVAADKATRFVLVSLITHEDHDIFQESGWEWFLYRIRAVALGKSGTDADSNVKAAAARIHALLQDAVLTIPDYALMRCGRTERKRWTEVDEVDGARWQHRGGDYEVWAQPIPA